MVIYCLIFSTMSRWFCVYIWTRELLQVGVRPPGLAVSSRSVYIPASWEPPGGDQQPTRTGCPQWWEFSVRCLGLFGHTTDQIYIFLPDDWSFYQLAYVSLLFPIKVHVMTGVACQAGDAYSSNTWSHFFRGFTLLHGLDILPILSLSLELLQSLFSRRIYIYFEIQ